MDSARPNNTKNLLSLKQAAERLAVSTDVLLNLNEFNILKPTITLSGEIGYTEEQIENFLIIQQLAITEPRSKSLNQRDYAHVNQPSPTHTQLNTLPSSSYNSANEIKDYVNLESRPRSGSKSEKSKSTQFLTLASISFVFFSLIFYFPTIQNHLNRMNGVSQVQGLGNSAANSKISELNPEGSTTLVSPIPIKNKPASDNNLTSENTNPSWKNVAFLNKVFDSKTANNNSGNESKSVNTEGQTKNIEAAIKSGAANETGFASRTSCPSCVNNAKKEASSVFDENGNIKGDAPKTNILGSTAINSPNANQIANPVRSTSPIILLIAISIALFSVMFNFKKQPAMAINNFESMGIERFSFQNAVEVVKILELKQKTDGTVAIFFKGQEYKVSKPELDSESDQFITRLMELVETGEKEIDYDTLNDQKIRFNTPLSKLVTRLGFVGVKRDIFFPRTSKTKVLFRKYITEDDLISMGFSSDQLPAYFN